MEKQTTAVSESTPFETIVYNLYFTTFANSNLYSFAYFVKNTQLFIINTKKISAESPVSKGVRFVTTAVYKYLRRAK